MSGVFIRKKKTVQSHFLSLSSRDTTRSWQSTGQENAFITHWPGPHFNLGLQIWGTKIVSLRCPMYAIPSQMLLQSHIPHPSGYQALFVLLVPIAPIYCPVLLLFQVILSFTPTSLYNQIICECYLIAFLTYSLKCTKIQYLVLFLNQINKVNYLNSQLNDLLVIILLASQASAFHTVFTETTQLSQENDESVLNIWLCTTEDTLGTSS